MSKKLTVKDMIELIRGDWQLIGGKTGKKLAGSWSKGATKAKYLNDFVSDQPIFAGLDVTMCKITNTGQYVKPVVYIWVEGR